MPAKSKKQQRFFGMVHARQKGKKVGGSEVAKVAKDIDFDDAEDFASTKHKGLPEKVKKKDESVSLWEQFKTRKEESVLPPPPPPRKKRQDATFTNAQGQQVQYPKVAPPRKKFVPKPDIQSSEYNPEDLKAQARVFGSRSPFGN